MRRRSACQRVRLWVNLPAVIGRWCWSGGRAAACVAAVLLAGTASAQAEPPPDPRLAKVRERRQALEKDLSALRRQERTLLGEVERLELEVRLRTEELREAQLVLQRTNQQLDETARRSQELEARVAAARPALAQRARALYKLGELSYVRLLLSVDRPADLLRGYRFVSALARRDHERVSGFRADLTSLATTRVELERRTREAQELRTQLERARRALDGDRRRKTDLLVDIVGRKESQAQFLSELQRAEQQLAALLGGLGGGEVAIPVGAFKGSLPWPVEGEVRGAFGRHRHPRFATYTVSNGIDVAAAPDVPVAAVHEGTVVFAERFRGYGLMVVLDHGDKHHTLYAHLGEALVRPGQKVVAGEVIGTVGATGLEGPGLYFEVRVHGQPEDPLAWLARREGR